MHRLRLCLLAATLTSLALAASASANTAPVCNGFSYNEGHVDQAYGTTVGCNDADPGTRLTYAVVDAPAHGTVSPGWSYGIFVYKPQAGYIGDDSFTARANDGQADSAGLFTVMVSTKADAAPQLCAAGSTPYPVRTDGSQVLPLGWVFCLGGPMPRDVDLVTGPAHGTLSGPATAPIYTPDPGYAGADEITFRLRNATGASAQVITWPILVSPTADIAPQCFGADARVVADTVRSIDLACLDGDVEPVAISIGTPPQHGTLSTVVQDPFSGVARSFQPIDARSTAHGVYTPESGYTGPDRFTIVADDGRQTTTMPVRLTVAAAAANQAPACSGSGTSISAGSPVVVFAGCSDPDGDPVTTAVVTPPAHGTLGPWLPRPGYGPLATYTPNAGFLGADLISIQGTDSYGAVSPVTTFPVTVVGASFAIAPQTWGVCPVRMLAVARNAMLTTAPMGCATIDAAPVTVTIDGAPAHGQATITAAGGLRFVPEHGYVGGDGLTLRLDSAGRTTTIAVTVVIRADGSGGDDGSGEDSGGGASGGSGGGVASGGGGGGGGTGSASGGAGSSGGTGTGTSVGSSAPTEPAPGGAPGGSGPGSSAPRPSANSTSAKAKSPRAALAAGLTTVSKRATVLHRGRTTLPFTVPAAGKLGVRWYATVPSGQSTRQVLVASGSRAAAAPGSDVTVTLALTAAGRKLLHAATGPVKVRAVATFTPAGGSRVVVTRTLTLG